MTKPELTIGEVNRVARKIQCLAWRGAGRKGNTPPWHEIFDEQRNACRAVARWHLRQIRKAIRE